VRVARLLGTAVLVGLVCIVVPALGSSSSGPSSVKAAGACRAEFLSGLEAVFGRFRTQQQAYTFRSRVTARGFVNTNVIEGCSDYRLVLRGIDTFDVGVALQAEARREGFSVTLECIQAKQLGRWEGILGHGRDRAAGNAIVARAAAAGFPGVRLRNDPCGGFEAYVAGFPDRGTAETFVATAKTRGFADAAAQFN
jgi:hypothetical protein